MSTRSFLAAFTLLAAASSTAAAPPSDQEVRALLTRVLEQDSHELVRTAAAVRLAPLGDPRALDQLRGVVAGASFTRRAYHDALGGLRRVGGEAVVEFLAEHMTAAPMPWQRGAVCKVLFYLAPSRALELAHKVVLDPARTDDGPLAGEAALGILRGADGPQVTGLLRAAFRKYGNDDTPARYLFAAMHKQDRELARVETLRALREGADGLRLLAARKVSKFGEEVAVPEWTRLLRADPFDGVRFVSANGLRRFPDSGFGATALEVLGDGGESVELRAHLAYLLGRLAHTGAEDTLLAALREGEPQLAVAAAGALGNLKSLRALPEFRELLAPGSWADQPVPLQRAAALALHGMPAGEVRPLLAGILAEHPTATVAQGAATALSRLGDPDSWQVLREAFTSSREEARRAAASVVGRIDAFLPLLGERLRSDPSPSVREVAARAVGETGGDDRLELLLPAMRDPARGVRIRALRALGHRKPWARAAEREALSILDSDPDPGIRLPALGLLNLAGTEPAHEGIMNAAFRDADESIRKKALMVLSWNSHEHCLEASRRTLAGDPSRDVRTAAAGYLGEIDPARGYTELRRAVLRDGEARVRRAAALGLGRLLD